MQLRDDYRKLSEQLIDDIPVNVDALSYTRVWHEQVKGSGLYGINIGQGYGGLGLGHVGRFAAIEAMAFIDPSAGAILQSITLGIGLFLSASESQKEVWLPRLATGDEVASICITESISGARIRKMETFISEDGNGGILNGEKRFIAQSHFATVHGIIALSNLSNRATSHIGCIVPAILPGVNAGKIDKLDGLKRFNVGQLLFNDVKLRSEHIVHNEDGIKLAHRSITLFGKLNLSAIALGCLRRSWAVTLEYLDSPVGKVKGLSGLSPIRSMIGEVQGAILRAESLCYAAAESIDKGNTSEAMIMSAKIESVNAAIEGILKCVSIMGARGGLEEYCYVQRICDVVQVMAPAGTESANIKQLSDIALGLYQEVVHNHV